MKKTPINMNTHEKRKDTMRKGIQMNLVAAVDCALVFIVLSLGAARGTPNCLMRNNFDLLVKIVMGHCFVEHYRGGQFMGFAFHTILPAWRYHCWLRL